MSDNETPATSDQRHDAVDQEPATDPTPLTASESLSSPPEGYANQTLFGWLIALYPVAVLLLAFLPIPPIGIPAIGIFLIVSDRTALQKHGVITPEATFPAWGWGLLTFFFGPLVMPFYLYRRAQLTSHGMFLVPVNIGALVPILLAVGFLAAALAGQA